MIKSIKISILLLILSGCSTHFESVNQVNDTAYLQLGGDFIGTQLSIDSNPLVNLTEDSIETFKLNGKKVARFPISTGKHHIKIIRSGNVIVNRNIYVTNSNTFEVVIP